MSIYAIADLHLSFDPAVDKPMDIYGPRWYEQQYIGRRHGHTAG